VTQVDEISESISRMNWKVQDVVVIPSSTLPDEADRADFRNAGAAAG
jgi:hypothetical protein